MPMRTCDACGFTTYIEEYESFSKKHPRCNTCGLFFGDGHLAKDTDGLCQYCAEEETGDVDLDKEDSELDMEES